MPLLHRRARFCSSALLLPVLISAMFLAPAGWAQTPAGTAGPASPQQLVARWVKDGLAEKSETPWLLEKLTGVSAEGVEKIRDALGSRMMDRRGARQDSYSNSSSDGLFLASLGVGMVAGGAGAAWAATLLKNPGLFAQLGVLGATMAVGVAGGLGYQYVAARIEDSRVRELYKKRIDGLATRYTQSRVGQDAFYRTVDGYAEFDPGTTLSLDRAELVRRADSALQVALTARQNNNHQLFVESSTQHYAQNDYMTAVESLLRKDLLALHGQTDPDQIQSIYQNTLRLLNSRYEGIDFPAGHRWQLHRRLALAAHHEVQQAIATLTSQLDKATGTARSQLQERIARLQATSSIVSRYPDPPAGGISMEILGSRRAASAPSGSTGFSGTGDGTTSPGSRSGTGDGNVGGTGDGGIGRTGGGTGGAGTGSGDSTDPLHHNDINRR
jgi:hypothetical protein